MAEASGISPRKVHGSGRRAWRRIGCGASSCRPIRRSPRSLRDVVGLYIDPPRHAIVLSLDEKSQVQALDRTQPGLPMKTGRAGTMTHDYMRHGTTTLFAALNVLDGTVVGQLHGRHRHQEFLRFLNAIEPRVPPGKVIHVILDNYAAHKHPNVRKWLVRHPRWVFHFTPTSCSWLNAIEGFFATLTRRRLKRGAFPSLVALQEAINRFIEHNQRPSPSSGKPIPRRSSKPSNAGIKRWRQSTSGGRRAAQLARSTP